MAVSDADDPGSAGQWRLKDITVTDPTVMRRAVAAAAIGNVTEW